MFPMEDKDPTSSEWKVSEPQPEFTKKHKIRSETSHDQQCFRSETKF